jgi:hypothetical protein
MSYNLNFSIKSKGEDKNNDKYCCDTIKDFEISVPQSISRSKVIQIQIICRRKI